MKQRGRKGVEQQQALAIAEISVGALDRVERQRPPHDLTDEEVEVWVSIVNTEQADWFSPGNVPLLTQLCRHVVHARRVAELLERALSDVDPETKRPTLTIQDYDRLLKMQERESGAMMSLATKLRITNQSITNQRGNFKTNTASRKPWED